MILLTGGVGFIGSNVLATLNARGRDDVLLVDVLGDDGRYRNIAKHGFADVLHPNALESFLDKGRHSISAVIHLGAISSTLEQDADKIYTQNVRCSRLLWDWCTKHLVPFVYASSAATYGDGGLGFRDNVNYQENRQYRPLNPYGWSKHVFDQFCLKTYEASHPCPPQWFGLKFFNVYGPNEYHKTGQHSGVPLRRATVGGELQPGSIADAQAVEPLLPPEGPPVTGQDFGHAPHGRALQ